MEKQVSIGNLSGDNDFVDGARDSSLPFVRSNNPDKRLSGILIQIDGLDGCDCVRLV